MPRCVRLKLCPAMVKRVERSFRLGFAVSRYITALLPVTVVGAMIVNQDVFVLTTVQVQLGLVVTLTIPVVAAYPLVRVVAEREKVQGPAVWLMVKDWPAIVTRP